MITLKEPGLIFSFIFFLFIYLFIFYFGDLLSHESSCVSHNPWQISQLKVFRLEEINENMPGYGNSKIQATAICKTVSYIKTTWLYQPKFKIDIFEVMILQMKQKTNFFFFFCKIRPCTSFSTSKLGLVFKDTSYVSHCPWQIYWRKCVPFWWYRSVATKIL